MPRMPHNNRMSTSASLKSHDIWKSTIGHDPYADTTEENEKTEKAKLDQEKAKTLLQLARSQNKEGSNSRNGMVDDYAKKMFFGLKGVKKRRADLMDGGMNGGLGDKLSEDARRRLEEDSSSSEDEFVEEGIDDEEEVKEMKKEEDRKISADQEEKSKKKKKKRKSRKKYSSSSSSSSSDSDDSSSYHRSKKRRKKDERKKKSRKKDKGDEDRKKKKRKHH